MAWPLKPVVLCFPDHSSGVSRQDQVGARKPSTRTVCSRATASSASSAVRPVLLGGRLDKRRELRDDRRDHRLGRVEDFRPDFLDDILAHVPACDYDGLSEGQAKGTRFPYPRVPRVALQRAVRVRLVAVRRVLTYDRTATASPFR